MLRRTILVGAAAAAFSLGGSGAALACHGEGSRGEAAASLVAFRTVGTTHVAHHHGNRALVAGRHL